MIVRAVSLRRRAVPAALVGLAAIVFLAGGCRQYDVNGSKVRAAADPNGRAKVSPGPRSGLSEQAQDIERSVGF